MLGRSITYEDADGNTVTETFWFHFTKTQFMEFLLEFGNDERSIEQNLTNLVRSENTKAVFASTKDLILAAYGERSEDGKGFKKSPELRQKFEDSFAFDALFQELGNDEGALNKWMQGIMPKGLNINLSTEEVKAALAEVRGTETVSLPSVTPPTPPPVPKE